MTGLKDFSNKETLIQFIKFGLVGIGNTAVSMAIYYLVLWLNPAWYMLGSILGAVISILNAFVWNRLLVFRCGKQTAGELLRELSKCFVSYGGTSALAQVLLWIEVAFLGVGKAVAPIVNLLITIPLNFVLNKLWVFKK